MAPHLLVHFPQQDRDVVQDAEYCEVTIQDTSQVTTTTTTTIRFHDYAQVFAIPGLYDRLFGGPESMTKCVSPQVLAGMLEEHLHDVLPPPKPSATAVRLRVLDFGAGNGMMAQAVRGLCSGAPYIVGFDILPEAKLAAERDRPGVYDEYIVVEDIRQYVDGSGRRHGEVDVDFDVLVSASALMFGDATAQALQAAVGLVRQGGLVVFNVHEQFVDWENWEKGGDFGGQLPLPVPAGLRILGIRRYCHRLSVTGKELFYVAVVALKEGTAVD